MATAENRAGVLDSVVGAVGIVAGNGRMPIEIAQQLSQQERPVFIVGIPGEASEEIEAFDHAWCEWESMGKMFKMLKKKGIKDIILAGGVVGRPEIKYRKLDIRGFMTFMRLLKAMISGDNAILTGIISVIEKWGFKVRSAAELVPSLLVQAGANTQLKPSSADLERISQGFEVVKALGPFDVGQGCVVVGKRAVAVEGVEGTDAMINRITEMRAVGRLPAKRGGVLIKAVKLGQDERADLPTIGPNTVLAVHEAGLTGIAVQANKSLMLDKEETLKLARQHKIFIYGYEPEGQG